MANHYIYTLSDPFTDELRYVGKTSRTPEKRFKEHMYEAKRNKKKLYSCSWIRSLSGAPPKMEILEVLDDETECLKTEVFWISQFRALGFKLVNICDGGHGVTNGKDSKPILDDLGNRFSSMSETARFYGRTHAQIHSVVTGLRKSAAGRTFYFEGTTPKLEPGEGKAYKAIKDQYGKIYKGITVAAVELGLVRSQISAVVTKQQTHVKGWQFAFLNDECSYPNMAPKDLIKMIRLQATKNKRKPIKDQNEVVYSSLTEASLILGINRNAISAVVTKKQKTTKGYSFEYVGS